MNNDDRVAEGLSALADGECDELESARTLKALRADAALRDRWSRIHLARAVMRGEHGGLLGEDFAGRVARAVDGEAHMLVPERAAEEPPRPRRWARPLAGLAIAASVAVVSVVGLQSLERDAPQRSALLAETPLTGVEAPLAVPAAVNGGTRWDLDRGEIAQRLNGYLLNHMEYAAMGEMQGMLPYSRLAGYDRVPTQ